MATQLRSNASRRTKNRTQEHNLVAERNQTPKNGHLFGTPSILFYCTECEWEGWLPVKELLTWEER